MYTCCIQSLKILASLCSWAGWFESNLSKIPVGTFSRDVAQMLVNKVRNVLATDYSSQKKKKKKKEKKKLAGC